jgi:hypothetical protein
LSINDASRQFRPKANLLLSSEHAMIADIQTQEMTLAATEAQEQLAIVQDAELLFVGGGGTSGCMF